MHYTLWNSAYTPIRYEPIYETGISTTAAVTDYPFDNFDSNFSLLTDIPIELFIV